MSPGGRMRFSRRRRPELPRSAGSSRRRVTYSLRPRRRVERPVPPPRATTLRPWCFLERRFFTGKSGTRKLAHFTESGAQVTKERIVLHVVLRYYIEVE